MAAAIIAAPETGGGSILAMELGAASTSVGITSCLVEIGSYMKSMREQNEQLDSNHGPRGGIECGRRGDCKEPPCNESGGVCRNK